MLEIKVCSFTRVIVCLSLLLILELRYYGYCHPCLNNESNDNKVQFYNKASLQSSFYPCFFLYFSMKIILLSHSSPSFVELLKYVKYTLNFDIFYRL